MVGFPGSVVWVSQSPGPLSRRAAARAARRKVGKYAAVMAVALAVGSLSVVWAPVPFQVAYVVVGVAGILFVAWQFLSEYLRASRRGGRTRSRGGRRRH